MFDDNDTGHHPGGRVIGGEAVSDLDMGLREHMLRVYNYMSMGLGLTGLTAYFASTSDAFMQLLFGTPLKWVVIFAPLAMVFVLAARIPKMSFSSAQLTFWGYSILMGLSLSSIFIVFQGMSIARVFFITAGMFGGMSLYGYTTKRDLTSFGSFLFMGLIGLVIASIVNVFVQSSMMHMILSVIGVLVFTGLTAYDTQKIKEVYLESDSSEVAGKKALMGALALYLDFVNLFMSLLHLLGDRR